MLYNVILYMGLSREQCMALIDRETISIPLCLYYLARHPVYYRERDRESEYGNTWDGV